MTWLDPSTGEASTKNYRRSLKSDDSEETIIENVRRDLTSEDETVTVGLSTVALAQTQAPFSSSYGFRSTNGNVLQTRMGVTRRSTISFSTAQCWYLDSTFCFGFHEFKESVGVETAGVLIRFIVFGIFTLAMCVILYFTYRLVMKGINRPDKETLTEAILNALPKQGGGHGVLLWTCLLILAIAPLVFYTQIFHPCFSCFDFEAAATHEIGHALGLSHPDNSGGQFNAYNSLLVDGHRWNASTCKHPWESVEMGVPDGVSTNSEGYRVSVTTAASHLT